MEIDPKTVTKYCRMDEKEFQSYRSEIMFRDKVLGKYEKDILEIYEKNEFKKLNMSSVYDYLEERYGNLPGNEKTLRNFISYLLQTDKLTLNKNIRAYTKVPELPFGKQMQLDFGQYTCLSGLKLFIFATVLSASRYKYVIFQDHPFKTKEVIFHLLSCFEYYGGKPKELVIDQDSLMVVSENDILMAPRVCLMANWEANLVLEIILGTITFEKSDLRITFLLIFTTTSGNVYFILLSSCLIVSFSSQSIFLVFTSILTCLPPI